MAILAGIGVAITIYAYAAVISWAAGVGMWG